jgi:hypothetical protein
MLRFSFLPCDFHPLVLLLGEAVDLTRFARCLRRFASDNVDVALERTDFVAPSDTSIELTRRGEWRGLWLVDSASKQLQWVLASEQAEEFASRVERLANPAIHSGSELLMCEVIGEIPAKVSRGEFSDNFLLAPRP